MRLVAPLRDRFACTSTCRDHRYRESEFRPHWPPGTAWRTSRTKSTTVFYLVDDSEKSATRVPAGGDRGGQQSPTSTGRRQGEIIGSTVVGPGVIIIRQAARTCAGMTNAR